MFYFCREREGNNLISLYIYVLRSWSLERNKGANWPPCCFGPEMHRSLSLRSPTCLHVWPSPLGLELRSKAQPKSLGLGLRSKVQLAVSWCHSSISSSFSWEPSETVSGESVMWLEKDGTWDSEPALYILAHAWLIVICRKHTQRTY